jgi:hypothetical protein
MRIDILVEYLQVRGVLRTAYWEFAISKKVHEPVTTQIR